MCRDCLKPWVIVLCCGSKFMIEVCHVGRGDEDTTERGRSVGSAPFLMASAASLISLSSWVTPPTLSHSAFVDALLLT